MWERITLIFDVISLYIRQNGFFSENEKWNGWVFIFYWCHICCQHLNFIYRKIFENVIPKNGLSDSFYNQTVKNDFGFSEEKIQCEILFIHVSSTKRNFAQGAANRPKWRFYTIATHIRYNNTDTKNKKTFNYPHCLFLCVHSFGWSSTKSNSRKEYDNNKKLHA